MRPLHRMWRRTLDTIHVTRVELPVRGLPEALRGVTACQISDFHVDRDEDLERLELAVETINAERPDLIFLTGDYFSGADTMNRYIGAFRSAISKLRPGAELFAILGNHDHWSSAERITEALKRSGARVLANSSGRLALRGESLTIVGIDDLWSRRAEPARAFAGVAPDECTIVLAHNPDTALYARHLRPGVMLSGHTHGGVVRIPFYGSPWKSILRIGKRFYSGLNRYEDFFIYTNRGLGTMFVRIRINCPPEVSHFSLAPLVEAAPAEANRGRKLRPLKRAPRRPAARRVKPRAKRKPG
ncbi:MAG: metallophosphoesterase [Candidatus Binataceae bacterium]